MAQSHPRSLRCLTVVIPGDQAGRTVRYGYDDAEPYDFVNTGRLVSVTDPTGAVDTYTYAEASWLLTSQTDALGNTVFTNTYDDNGRVTRQVNHTGLDVTLGYAVITDTAQIVERVGTTEAAHLSALLVTTATDQQGTATYTYGSDGLLRLMTDPAGATTRYRGYTDTRQATEIEDALGTITRIAYNDLGLPVTITDPLGNQTRFAYDAWGQLTEVTDALGRTSTMAYDGPRMTSIADPSGQRTQFQYGEQAGWQNMVRAISYADSFTTTLSYDAAGDVVAMTDAANNQTQITYDEIGRPIIITDARGNSTNLSYDALNRVTQITDALSNTVQMEYDAIGNLITLRDQINATTLFTYTDGIRMTAMQDAAGGVVRMEYDDLSRPTAIIDQQNQRREVVYDRAGRVTAVTDPLGNRTQFAYDLLGNTTVITDANGHATSLTYDALSRPIEVRNAEGQFLRYGYDAVGNVVAITDTLGAAVALTYDDLNRLHTVTDQEGNITTYAYDDKGLLGALIDGNGRITRYEYDLLGRLEAVIANAQAGSPPGADTNVQTRFAYDPVGNLLRVTDPRNHTTTFTYDALNRTETVTDPLERTMQYAYDPRGLLEQWTKADGTAITYAYDVRQLLTELNAPDQTITYAYDALGRRVSMNDAGGETRYTYDANHQPQEITLSTGETVQYDYDAVGNRTRLIYPDGKAVEYTYNAANQVATVTDWDGGVTTYTYDDNGRPATTTLPNGVAMTATYDAAGQLRTVTHIRGDAVIGTYTSTYDSTGRTVEAVEDGHSITYTYDGLYRLIGADDSTGAQYRYTYDAAGNRVTKVEPNENVSVTYDAANQMLTVNGLPVEYDAHGNLLNDTTQRYTYDSLDRLIRVTRAITTTTFTYTGDGDRLREQTGGETTTYTLDLSTVLTQVIGQQHGSSSTWVLPGIGQQTDGVWQYVHLDALGSVRALTDVQGQVIGTRRYTPFGAVEAGSGVLSPFGFTGEPHDEATGLVYLRARYYSPALGRFLTPDSIVPDVLNGQAWNAYAYVYHDPINLVDPSGYAAQGRWQPPVPPPPLPLTPRFPPAAQEAAQRADDLWQDLRGGAEALGTWWHEKPTCGCHEEGLHPRWSLAAGVTGATLLGIATTPFQAQGTLTTYERQRYLGIITTDWQPMKQESGPYRAMQPRKPPGWRARVIASQRVPGTFGLVRRDTAWHLRRSLKSVPGMTGIWGGFFFGALVDAGIETWGDWSRCLSPADRFHNGLVAGGAGLASTGVGAAAFGITAWSVPAARGAPLVVGIIAGLGAGNFPISPVTQWKNRHLR